MIQSSKERNVFAGGKGLNQSVALAKAGLETYHAGQVGKDADGDLLLKVMAESGVNVSLVNRIDGPCGHTMIQVDKNGRRSFPVLARETLSCCKTRSTILIRSWMRPMPRA